MRCCTACQQQSPLIQAKFPGTPKREKENYTKAARAQLKRLQHRPKAPLREAKKAASNVFEAIATEFQEKTGHSFIQCSAEPPKTRVLIRPTKQELKAKKRETLRQFKTVVEQEYSKSATATLLGTRTSKEQYKQIRMMQGFEAASDEPPTLDRSHTPLLEKVKFGKYDEHALIEEVNLLEE